MIRLSPLLLLACASPDPLTPTADLADSSPVVEPEQTDSDPVDAVDPVVPETEVLPDLAAAGPLEVLVETATREVNGCSMTFTRYLPGSAEDTALVVLAHGFMRNQVQMSEWARHLASWGLTVLTPQLCHASIFDTDHPQNGLDLVQLAAEEAVGRGVVYGGQSAGGLAALLAASADPDALGVIGLDLTDTANAARTAAPELAMPLYGLVGEPSSCNTSNNGLAAYDGALDAVVLRIAQADHCDFENPTNVLCTAICNNGAATTSPDVIRDAVAELTVAAALVLTDLDPRGEAWWTPGEAPHDALRAAGVLTDP